MKSISIAGTQAPAIIQGCMRIDAMSVKIGRASCRERV